jgi:hypothetical protein
MIFAATDHSGSILYQKNTIRAMGTYVGYSRAVRGLTINALTSRFSLTPTRLWQPPARASLPEFMPRKWSGEKRVFTSFVRSYELGPGLLKPVLQTFPMRGCAR